MCCCHHLPLEMHITSRQTSQAEATTAGKWQYTHWMKCLQATAFLRSTQCPHCVVFIFLWRWLIVCDCVTKFFIENESSLAFSRWLSITRLLYTVYFFIWHVYILLLFLTLFQYFFYYCWISPLGIYKDLSEPMLLCCRPSLYVHFDAITSLS